MKKSHKIILFLTYLFLFQAAIASCSPTTSSHDSSASPTSPALAQSEQWRAMTETEQEQAWKSILNSPLGIAALNQLAIEGFIGSNCPKTFYLNEKYGGLQFLLRVKCPTARGVSIALDYEEVRVVFNLFEDNIENFQVERIFPEKAPTILLPD